MMEAYLAGVCVLLLVTGGQATGGGVGRGGWSNTAKHQLTEAGCVVVDELCLVPEEIPNYEAIKSLHSQLDDDHSGDIDVAEAVDFLKEELQYAKGYEKRQKSFHHNDQYISVRELWYIWKKSEVHNWTVDQTVAWLAESVELKQYAQNFYANAVNGSSLPSTVLSVITPTPKRRNSRYSLDRLAANNEQFLSKVLGIKDPKHRSKITIKAMDVVLFGPPKDTGSHLKDLVLVSLLTLALIGCFKAYQRNREYEGQLSDMLKDMEKLREAEENLHQLEVVMATKVKNKERSNDKIEKNHADEVQQLKLQLEEEREKNEMMMEQMKRGLEEADHEEHPWRAPLDLQHWLQLTYERERIASVKKQSAAREQFDQAREMCEKLNRQRRSLMGIMASVHGKMDNVDQAISQARTTMEEVTRELREREHRWRNIEMLAGCSITTNNPGLHALELMLCPPVNGPPHSTYGSSIGATSYYAGSSLSSSGIVRSPAESLVEVPGSSGGMTRKRSQLIPRDSGSSLGSESSVTQSCVMHHSHTYSTGLMHHALERESMRRVSSTGSIGCIAPGDQEQVKDLQDSSAEETDVSGCTVEGSSFTMGGSRLTLNLEGGRAVSPSQVSLSSSPPSMHQHGSVEGGKEQKPSPRRSPMLKSYSQDTTGPKTEAKLKEKEKISASEPALDNPKPLTMAKKKATPPPVEEGTSSDSSDGRKKSSKGRGFLGSLKLKSKKHKDIEKDSSKKNTG